MPGTSSCDRNSGGSSCKDQCRLLVWSGEEKNWAGKEAGLSRRTRWRLKDAPSFCARLPQQAAISTRLLYDSSDDIFQVEIEDSAYDLMPDASTCANHSDERSTGLHRLAGRPLVATGSLLPEAAGSAGVWQAAGIQIGHRPGSFLAEGRAACGEQQHGK